MYEYRKRCQNNRQRFFDIRIECTTLHPFSAAYEQVDLLPLHVFGDGVAFFDGSETALWGEGDVVADDGFCFGEAGFEVVHAFEHRIFRGDEPSDEAFVVVLHAGPWREGTGAFVVVFDEINIVRDLHDDRRDGIVESGEERFALKIALAEMGGDGHVGRMIFQRFRGNAVQTCA